MKPIRMKSNLKVADNVRKAINRTNTSTLLMQRGHFECFDNCREQGYVLQLSHPTTLGSFFIAFSENRNSDEIVVYCYKNASYPSNLPKTDEDWNDRNYFRPDHEFAAAAFIISRAEHFLATTV